MRRDLFEQSQPFPTQGVFELNKAGGVTARPRHAVDVSGTKRVHYLHEHDRHGVRCLQQWPHCRITSRKDDIRRESGQLARMSANLASIASAPAGLDSHVASVGPTQLLQPLLECCEVGLCLRIDSRVREDADESHALTLLRARRERPCDSCTAEQRDELAPFHSITSSARASSVDGTSRPSALAVLRLITRSYLVDACTGSSAGFTPLRMRSM